MNEQNITIKRALISVSDKTGIVELAKALSQLNIEIISTGGTSQLLREAGVSVQDVATITQFPEMMDGRVKTLHPKIHGGILGLRDKHEDIARQQNINWIDLVIVNLYPFSVTINNPQNTFDDAIENIDIGGPAMIRSAAKNMGWVGVVVDPADYQSVIDELTMQHTLSFAMRKRLALKAFSHTAEYDAIIAAYLRKSLLQKATGEHALRSEGVFPDKVNLNLKKISNLRYGENPHQSASAYCFLDTSNAGIFSAKQHQGKDLSYNNIVDADSAIACVREFSQPACVIVKHANPCGMAVADAIDQAFSAAFKADATSAFGGIIALNRECDEATAEKITELFFEVLIAPAYSKEALAILAKKTNLRVLELNLEPLKTQQEFKFIEGGLLIQDKNVHVVNKKDLKIVTQLSPSEKEWDALLFAWQLVKHIKSNAILITKKNVTVGIGAGQVSRIDAVDIALRKAGDNLSGAVLASDAFFPFRDSIDRLAKTGISAIIQPGGSVRDEEVIAACNEHGIAMVFTGVRCFKH